MTTGTNTGVDARLLSIVQRIENLNEQKEALSDDIREIFLEAKSAGFENKIVREVIKRRKLSPAERREQDDLVERYEQALGMFE
jgi:uncharacterized protein (UPF0335 family)